MTPQRICLLTLDVVGPIRNGGIGTAFMALAERLRDAGHHVTVLYPPAHSETLPVTVWQERYRSQGIDFVSLYSEGLTKFLALDAYHWLKKQQFDVIHYHEWRGLGYWLTVAKRCGLAFRDTTLVCQLHSPVDWHRRNSGDLLHDPTEVELDWLERRSAEGADAVYSPSQYMLDYVEAEGWALPAARCVLPNLLPSSFAIAESTANAPLAITELVFFGRLESRKGLPLFCRALKALAAGGEAPAAVSFLGKVGEVAGRSALAHIVDAAADWPFPWRVVNDRDVAGARAFLAEPGRLAVIASETENSPYVVLECLGAGVPFVAPDVGGIAELVAPEDHATALYQRTPDGLARALRAALAGGARPARPRLGWEELKQRWLAWQDDLRPGSALFPHAPECRDTTQGTPLVSVCLGTFNRPGTLAEAIASIEAQTYPNIEVVLVDDCSTLPAQVEFLEALKPRFEARGWTVLRNEKNSWQGVTRARAVAASRGEYLLMMDDDNVAWPDEIEVFVRAAEASGADLLSCQQQVFEGGGPPPSARAETPGNGWIPVGAAAGAGVFDNSFGDANMFMRRATWDRLGGFTPDRAYFEDWEFFQQATLAGLKVECLPEILFCYRVWTGGQTAEIDQVFLFRSYERILRPVLEHVPEPLRPAIRFALQKHLLGMQERREGYWSKSRPPSDLDRRLQGLNANSAEAFVAAAEAALGAGQPDAARALAEQALRLSPQHRAASELLGAIA